MTTEKIPDVRHPGGMSAEKIPDVIHPGGMAARSPYPDSLREKHTALTIITHPDDSISYPDMLSGSLSHPPCIPDLLMAKDFKALALHVSKLSIALPWIPKNSPQSRIALVIKKLSKHQNLTQFD